MLKLTKDKVLVAPEPVGKTVGGLFLSERHNPPCTGRVVAAGPKAVELGVEVGQRVAIRPTHGSDFEYEGKKYLLLFANQSDMDILGILDSPTSVVAAGVE